ncbi:calcitonin gene-related peptide type 1 receptor-like [Limulus polyphemus]|uniref:Calcitonin gene-related peptide type 1 receptor-like n=1 Tax=Limulus polyphemus TaxID=6850 RepID=A0ABM1B284_LIMPO|nr:calcitonin gene-related peptide type 1 receptor-like [Limulus polyphemus]
MENLPKNHHMNSALLPQALKDQNKTDGPHLVSPGFVRPTNISTQTSPREVAMVICKLQYQNVVYTEAHAFRLCDETGNWVWGNWTNYTECLQLLHQDWLCKTILSLKMYAAMASINWMFIEGLLLHTRITISVFSKDAPFKIYYLVGWGFPLLFIISWSIIMARFLNTPCWKGYGKTYYMWIVTGPMITALVVNTVFLVNVVRILVTKLRMNNSIETTQVRKAIKATALLFPLLGITHLLFCINPRDDAHLERAYMITNALLQSSQVQTALRNAYLRAILRRNPNHRLMRGRGLSRTSATYLSSYDTTFIDAARHKKNLKPVITTTGTGARRAVGAEKLLRLDIQQRIMLLEYFNNDPRSIVVCTKTYQQAQNL